ncbi:hypothetical protein [Flaviaesturariibacter terrae]
MTNTFDSSDLAALKQQFQEKRLQLQTTQLDPLAERVIYRELKALQYAISMKEAEKVILTLEE